MRAGRVRVLLGLPRRNARVLLPRARGPGGRRGSRDRRRAGARGARAAPDPGGVPGRGRRAVRLLHARADRGDPRPARAQSRAERARDPRGARRQPLPLHRLREDPRRGPLGRGGTHPVSGAGASPARSPVREGIGESVDRADGMLWGTTLRSPHPYARIRSIDFAEALALRGVHAIQTHEDVPGRKTYGLELADQPVLAIDVVRYEGEPVAIVAADHPETARRAAELLRVDYEPLEPLVDMDQAVEADEPRLHEDGNVLRDIHVRHGDLEAARAEAELVVEGEYEIGMQDQAFLGPESGLAIPSEDGGVDLYVATQWLHVDLAQVAASLDLPPERVRITNAGVGGAFGGREDLSMQIHGCMLALHTGRPVKMVYTREESFFGHVHRHPARLRYEHGAARDGRLVYVTARIVLDGGAYASSSRAVCLNAATTAAGPYDCPNAELDSYVVYTNNPPCGAMRGFGAVQTCFAYEAQMDKLAAAAGLDPLELRRRNAMDTGTRLPTGQAIDGPAPVRQLLEELAEMPLPASRDGGAPDLRELPGGVSNTTHGEGIRRGVGYAVGFKNVGFSAGFDDYSTARVILSVENGEPLVQIHTAAAEVGQGLITVQAQIAREVLGVERVIVLPSDTQVGNAGSSSASRQTWFTGGAVRDACEAVAAALLSRADERLGGEPDELSPDLIAELIGDDAVEETREYRPRRTEALDENGQGDAHLAFCFAAHRAVVDVDVELGLCGWSRSRPPRTS